MITNVFLLLPAPGFKYFAVFRHSSCQVLKKARFRFKHKEKAGSWDPARRKEEAK